ncbi:hypothetical protein HK102_012492 [Quaeritorhiza haematococci]|nr:hypothetical protein HK102_012492 [Quaeritorhiza haematococci]
MGGFRYITGFPNEPPVRPNMSLGDSLAGLHAAFGIVLALLARQRVAPTGTATGSGSVEHKQTGQVVDVAIYESGEFCCAF